MFAALYLLQLSWVVKSIFQNLLSFKNTNSGIHFSIDVGGFIIPIYLFACYFAECIIFIIYKYNFVIIVIV